MALHFTTLSIDILGGSKVTAWRILSHSCWKRRQTSQRNWSSGKEHGNSINSGQYRSNTLYCCSESDIKRLDDNYREQEEMNRQLADQLGHTLVEGESSQQRYQAIARRIPYTTSLKLIAALWNCLTGIYFRPVGKTTGERRARPSRRGERRSAIRGGRAIAQGLGGCAVLPAAAERSATQYFATAGWRGEFTFPIRLAAVYAIPLPKYYDCICKCICVCMYVCVKYVYLCMC